MQNTGTDVSAVILQLQLLLAAMYQSILTCELLFSLHFFVEIVINKRI